MPLPQGIQITPRDEALLTSLYAHDGVLAQRQARRLFYLTAGDRVWWARLQKLVEHQYVARPTLKQRYQHPVPEPILWLDVRGIGYLASQWGVKLPETLWQQALRSSYGLKQLRLTLRREGIYWREYPDWLRLPHHLAVCDVRITLTQAAKKARLNWHGWTPESSFKTSPDRVSYQLGEKHQTKTIWPDGFFAVSRANGKSGKHPFGFLVEVDMRTEDNPRFVREKIIPGQAYLESQAYQQRTGLKYGRWLIITTGPERVANMKATTEKATQRPWFYFTSKDQLDPRKLFTHPIWHQVGKDKPTTLLTPRH